MIFCNLGATDFVFTLIPRLVQAMKIKRYQMERLIYIFFCFSFSLILYCLGLFLWNVMGEYNNSTILSWIHIYGWLGILIYTFILLSWKKYSGMIFSPYIIFCTFVVLFNYGQFILWALGIHYPGELGTTNFIRYMDNYTLLKIEIVSSVSILSFHFGALLASFVSRGYNKKVYDKELFYKAIKIVSTLLLVISVPIIIYQSYQNLKVALEYGYSSIYYGDNIQTTPIFKYISYMFFPSLIGFLIANKFSPKSFKFVGGIFSVYLIINLLAGDRGSWIYYLIVLYWCYFTFIKKPRIKMLIKHIILGLTLLMISTVLVKFREIGFNNITSTDFLQIVQDASYVFIKPFFEMGQSARVLGIILQDNLWSSWKYGNTYMAAVISMFIPRTKIYFGYPDFYLDNWISQSYLDLDNYGIGFTITAEAFLNGGMVFFPVIMAIMGMFIGSLLKINVNSITNPKRLFLVLSSAGMLGMLPRGSFELNLRMWAYGTLVVLVMVELTKRLLLKKHQKGFLRTQIGNTQ